jgi:hypothetical protein
MSEQRRGAGVFPTSEEPITTPAWLRGEAAQPVENLVDRLKPDAGQPAPQAAEREPRPDAPLPPPPRKPGQRKERAKPAQDRAPPAPRVPKVAGIGALAPGARSIVPPALDGHDARLEGGMNAFAEAVTELAIARSSVLAAVEGDLLDLSLKIAEAIIESEVEQNTELHTVLVRAALRSLGDCSHVRMRTSQETFGALVEHMGSATFEMNGIAVELVADSTIPGLGCVIDEEHARVDATVAERLRSVRIAFEDERRRRPGGLE